MPVWANANALNRKLRSSGSNTSDSQLEGVPIVWFGGNLNIRIQPPPCRTELQERQWRLYVKELTYFFFRTESRILDSTECLEHGNSTCKLEHFGVFPWLTCIKQLSRPRLDYD